MSNSRSESLKFRSHSLKAANRYRKNSLSIFADLIGYVAASHYIDPTDVLLTPSVLTTGGMAEQGLADRGESIVPQLLDKLQRGGNDAYRLSVADVIQRMIEQRKISNTAYLTQLNSFFIGALRESNPYIRITAIQILSATRPSGAIEYIRDLELNDRYAVIDGPNVNFIVRNAARAALHPR